MRRSPFRAAPASRRCGYRALRLQSRFCGCSSESLGRAVAEAFLEPCGHWAVGHVEEARLDHVACLHEQFSNGEVVAIGPLVMLGAQRSGG